MSAEPLTRDERAEEARLISMCADGGHGDPCEICKHYLRYEATVQEREATLARVRNALSDLDGHTCWAGCADHLAMYRAIVVEVRAALEGAS